MKVDAWRQPSRDRNHAGVEIEHCDRSFGRLDCRSRMARHNPHAARNIEDALAGANSRCGDDNDGANGAKRTGT